MPELPEVETVRRGLAPVMEGARFDEGRGAARRPALAAAEGFREALEGQTVTGLGRRAKYLLADLSSGDVLLMHLGMSGSFRVAATAARRRPATTITSARRLAAHDHIVFHMSNGATVTFNDPRRFGCMKLVPRATSSTRSRCCARSGRSRSATRSMPRCWRRPARQEDQPEGGAARSARGRGARQHLCLRGAAPRASVAEAQGLDHRDAQPARRTSARRGWSTAIRAVLNDAIKAGGSSLRDHRQTDGALGMFQHNFRVYDREGEPCPTPRLQRHHQAHRADRTLDVLLPGVPEVMVAS